MWANKKPAAAAVPVPVEEVDAPPALPPGLKPMWSNKAKAEPAEDAGAPPPGLPPGVRPMWGNRAPPKPPEGSAATDDGSQTSGGSASTVQTGGPTGGLGSLRTTPLLAEGDASGGGEGPVGSGVALAKQASVQLSARLSKAAGEKPKKILPGTSYQYELGEKLGKGAYAKVKKCKTVETEEVFAVKIFKVSLLKRRRMWDSQVSGFKTAFDDVIREIAIMRQLRHPNVMNMYDVIDDVNANKLYMIMDFCDKGAIMQTENMPYAKGLDLDDCKRWFADSAVGLEYLHFQGVVHYDLKPDNILIGGDGRAIIADFGVSRIHPNKSDTTVGSPGTPTYTAPEVWGSGSYHGKLADVWSLGVTLHAMVFGCLPYAATSQVDLIACVTDPAEWECAYPLEDKALLELLHGMMQKLPEKRWSLDQVNLSEWIGDAVVTRKGGVDWEKIVISDEEVKKAVTHGHVANFKRTKHGTLFKLTDDTEMVMYDALHSSSASAFLPRLIGHNLATGKRRVVIELEDLTFGLGQPCLMDCKMGIRTYHELTKSSDEAPRADLLEKLQKVSPEAASEAERAQGGVSKGRYLRFRDEASSTKSLGFRIDAVQLSEECDASEIPTINELRLCATRDQVRDTCAKYLQHRRSLLLSFLEQMRELRATLETCDVFKTHSFIRSSLLFVYDGSTDRTLIRMIDLARVQPAPPLEGAAGSVGGNGGGYPGGELEATPPPRPLSHRAEWRAGNGEDGYLTGLDNMIDIFEGLLSDASVQ